MFLVSGVDLPGVVGMLGSLPTTTPRPTGWGWSQVVPAQPALDGPRRGELVPQMHPLQFDTDASCAPAGMLTAQLEGGFQRRRSCKWARSTGVIAGLQSSGSMVSPGLQGSTSQRVFGNLNGLDKVKRFVSHGAFATPHGVGRPSWSQPP
jgi:hypothetical protein